MARSPSSGGGVRYCLVCTQAVKKSSEQLSQDESDSCFALLQKILDVPLRQDTPRDVVNHLVYCRDCWKDMSKTQDSFMAEDRIKKRLDLVAKELESQRSLIRSRILDNKTTDLRKRRTRGSQARGDQDGCIAGVETLRNEIANALANRQPMDNGSSETEDKKVFKEERMSPPRDTEEEAGVGAEQVLDVNVGTNQPSLPDVADQSESSPLADFGADVTRNRGSEYKGSDNLLANADLAQPGPAPLGIKIADEIAHIAVGVQLRRPPNRLARRVRTGTGSKNVERNQPKSSNDKSEALNLADFIAPAATESPRKTGSEPSNSSASQVATSPQRDLTQPDPAPVDKFRRGPNRLARRVHFGTVSKNFGPNQPLPTPSMSPVTSNDKSQVPTLMDFSAATESPRSAESEVSESRDVARDTTNSKLDCNQPNRSPAAIGVKLRLRPLRVARPLRVETSSKNHKKGLKLKVAKPKSASAGKRRATGSARHGCTLCPKTFALRDSLVRHKTIHTARRFVCDICSKAFTTTYQLKAHKIRHMDPTQKPFECTYCERRFWSKQNVQVHTLIHTRVRAYTCHFSVCRKTFALPHHLSRHLKTHTGEKHHTCQLCSKKFSLKHHLTNHLLSHTETKHFVCQGCPKAFKYKHSLKNHSRRSHV